MILTVQPMRMSVNAPGLRIFGMFHGVAGLPATILQIFLILELVMNVLLTVTDTIPFTAAPLAVMKINQNFARMTI